MTRKDYKIIAEAVKLARIRAENVAANMIPRESYTESQTRQDGITFVIAAFVMLAKRQNPAFDGAKFTKACR